MANGSSSSSSSSTSCYVNPWYDDFSGTNGDLANLHMWNTIIVSGGSTLNKYTQDILTIQDNKLNFSPEPSGLGDIVGEIGTASGADVPQTFSLVGDFDVQLDFDSFEYTYDNLANTKEFGLVLSPVSGSDGASVLRTFGDVPFDTLDGFQAIGNISPIASSGGAYQWPVSAGKVRITRSGSLWKGYIWNTSASQWDWNRDTSGRIVTIGITDDVLPSVVFRSVSHPTIGRGDMSADVDNWTINSADEVTCPGSSSSSSVSSSSTSSSSSSSSSISSSSSSTSSSSSSSSLSSSSESSSSSSLSSSSSTSSSSTSLVIPSLKHFWYTLRDDEGVPRGGEQVYIYEAGTTTPMYIYDENALPISNPLTTGTSASSATEGVFEFYLKDLMWNNESPSGYAWDDRIKIQWDHDGEDKYSDRIMTWGDYYPVYTIEGKVTPREAAFDPLDFYAITPPTSADADYNDKNKTISNYLVCELESHRKATLNVWLSSSSSSSSSSTSSSSSSSSLSSSSSSSSTSSSSSSSSDSSSSSSDSSSSSSSSVSSSSCSLKSEFDVAGQDGDALSDWWEIVSGGDIAVSGGATLGTGSPTYHIASYPAENNPRPISDGRITLRADTNNPHQEVKFRTVFTGDVDFTVNMYVISYILSNSTSLQSRNSVIIRDVGNPDTYAEWRYAGYTWAGFKGVRIQARWFLNGVQQTQWPTGIAGDTSPNMANLHFDRLASNSNRWRMNFGACDSGKSVFNPTSGVSLGTGDIEIVFRSISLAPDYPYTAAQFDNLTFCTATGANLDRYCPESISSSSISSSSISSSSSSVSSSSSSSSISSSSSS